MKKYLSAIGIITILIAAAVLYSLNTPQGKRLQFVATLFTGAEQYENFANVANMFPSTRANPSTTPYQFPDGETLDLPSSFTYLGNSVDTSRFLKETDTGALFVLHSGEVRFEDYYLSGGREVNWLSMSVAKSFISAMLGIAIDEGHINSIEQAITDYVPALNGSAYDGVRIKDILQMSSGASWNEDYGNPDSDINRMGRIMAVGGSLNEFAATLTNEREPGTYNLYNSTDTQVLGMLLQAATGGSITKYMQEKLWQPLGMESPAYWMIDDDGMEMAFAGLNATARDYAATDEESSFREFETLEFFRAIGQQL